MKYEEAGENRVSVCISVLVLVTEYKILELHIGVVGNAYKFLLINSE